MSTAGSTNPVPVPHALKSYQDWINAGRHVDFGEKARFYAVKLDRSAKVPLFSEDQTQEGVEVDYHTRDWELFDADIVRAEMRESRKRPARVKVNVAATTRKGMYQLQIWCGPQTEIIKLLKENEYRYDSRLYRWIANREDPQRTLDSLVEDGIVVEIDSSAIPLKDPMLAARI